MAAKHSYMLEKQTAILITTEKRKTLTFQENDFVCK